MNVSTRVLRLNRLTRNFDKTTVSKASECRTMDSHRRLHGKMDIVFVLQKCSKNAQRKIGHGPVLIKGTEL